MAEKKGGKKIKQKSVQEWQLIDIIYDDGIIKLKNNRFIKILKVEPVNYNLKSDLEKNSILNSYKIFLKTCNFDIQILIQSSKENLDKHILKIQKNIQNIKNNYLKELSEDYIKYINKINLTKKSSSKNFYIIISNNNLKNSKNTQINEIIENDLKEKYFKIKECLSRCGNSVKEINSKENIEKIINSFFQTRKSINKKINIK